MIKRFLPGLVLAAALAAAWMLGHHAGVLHALTDSIIWTVECYDPNDPDQNLRGDGCDQTIYIELDGELWEHGMYQG